MKKQGASPAGKAGAASAAAASPSKPSFKPSVAAAGKSPASASKAGSGKAGSKPTTPEAGRGSAGKTSEPGDGDSGRPKADLRGGQDLAEPSEEQVEEEIVRLLANPDELEPTAALDLALVIRTHMPEAPPSAAPTSGVARWEG